MYLIILDWDKQHYNFSFFPFFFWSKSEVFCLPCSATSAVIIEPVLNVVLAKLDATSCSDGWGSWQRGLVSAATQRPSAKGALRTRKSLVAVESQQNANAQFHFWLHTKQVEWKDHFSVWHHQGTFPNHQPKSDHVCTFKLTIIMIIIIIIIIVASVMFGNLDSSMVGVVSLHNVSYISPEYYTYIKL